MKPTKTSLVPLFAAACLVVSAQAQDPNFQVYLAFGQSNMEGNAKDFNATDKVSLPRFQNLSAVACTNPSRAKDAWVAGVAPLARCGTGLTPVDYFARTLVDSLPSTVKIGVAIVAVAGTKIEGFDLSTYKSYYAGEATWMQNIANEYGGNPYARLVAMGKEAQKTGVIRGILLHQGESNSGDATWPTKVGKIYTSLLKDLNLEASKVPLLVGELVNADQGGACAGHNTIIAKLPQTIPTSHVISSKGLTCASDKLHFTSTGYREFGKRYATAMLALLRTIPSGVGPRETTVQPSADFALYDIRGARVAMFRSLDAAAMDREWSGMRQTLPRGIYWLRNTSEGTARKLLNER